jgi:hypothetical protein
VLGDGVGELVEFSLVNFAWGLGVNFGSGFFNPHPFVLGEGVVLGLSEILNSSFDFIVGEGSVVIGVKSFELVSGEGTGDAGWSSLLLLDRAEFEVLCDAVEEFVV